MPVPIPVPHTRGELSPLDPERNAEAYAELLSLIYHAEVAALDAFERLTDPEMVMPCDSLLRARAMLIRDEQNHLLDLQRIIADLGQQVTPEPESFTDLWNVQRARGRLCYPLPPYIAAMFILTTESLGYVILHHLAENTRHAGIQAVLASNLKDEQAHLRASMFVLERSLRDSDTALLERRFAALLDMAAHALAFGVLSRGAAKTLRVTLDAVGWDFAIVGASALEFTASLFAHALGVRSARLRMLGSPALVRLFELSAIVPEPPLLWPVLRAVAARLRSMSVA